MQPNYIFSQAVYCGQAFSVFRDFARIPGHPDIPVSGARNHHVIDQKKLVKGIEGSHPAGTPANCHPCPNFAAQ